MGNLNSLNYRMLLVLLSTLLVPSIYTTVRVYYLGSIPETWGYNIASQVVWLNLLYEILSEGLLLPMFFVFGQVANNKKLLANRIALALWVLITSYSLISLFVYLFAPVLVMGMGQSKDILQATVAYIRLETVAILLSSAYALVSVVWVTLKLERLMCGLLILKTLLTILFDSFFVSDLSISLHLGVNGVAWTNIIVNGAMLLVSVFWLVGNGFSLMPERSINSYGWCKRWVAISVKSGLESFVRNLAFMLMILKMVNEVQQQGTFWVTNQFIWGWLLLPVLALGSVIKQDVSTSRGELEQRWKGYFQITAIFALTWLITIPVWEGFINKVMGVSEFQAQGVFRLALLLIGFYIVFAFNNILDSYFYGLGRTDLMLYQSVIVNSIFYGSAYGLYLAGYYVPTLTSIVLMFGIGITIDALVTWWLYTRLHKVMTAQAAAANQPSVLV